MCVSVTEGMEPHVKRRGRVKKSKMEWGISIWKRKEHPSSYQGNSTLKKSAKHTLAHKWKWGSGETKKTKHECTCMHTVGFERLSLKGLKEGTKHVAPLRLECCTTMQTDTHTDTYTHTLICTNAHTRHSRKYICISTVYRDVHRRVILCGILYEQNRLPLFWFN